MKRSARELDKKVKVAKSFVWNIAGSGWSVFTVPLLSLLRAYGYPTESEREKRDSLTETEFISKGEKQLQNWEKLTPQTCGL